MGWALKNWSKADPELEDGFNGNGSKLEWKHVRSGSSIDLKINCVDLCLWMNTASPLDMRILFMRIHFTRAGTYLYRKFKIRVSRGPIVHRKFKLRDLPWNQNARILRTCCMYKIWAGQMPASQTGLKKSKIKIYKFLTFLLHSWCSQICRKKLFPTYRYNWFSIIMFSYWLKWSIPDL